MRSPLVAAGVAGLACLFAACSSAGSEPGQSATPGSSSPSDVQNGQQSGQQNSQGAGLNSPGNGTPGTPAVLRFVLCLRQHGLDVQVGPDGSSIQPADGQMTEGSGGPITGSGPGSAGSGNQPSSRPTVASDIDPAELAAAKAACAKEVPDYVDPSATQR